MQLNKNVELILAAIEAVVYRGDADNFVTFNLDDNFYIQFCASKGDYEIHCEAISNYHINQQNQLNDTQISILQKIGWDVFFESNGNYHIVHKVDSEKSRLNLAKLLWKTALLVYRCKSLDKREISHSFETKKLATLY